MKNYEHLKDRNLTENSKDGRDGGTINCFWLVSQGFKILTNNTIE